MVKIQIQLPDRLYREAKRVAVERELSLAEVLRRGVEYIARVYPPLTAETGVVWVRAGRDPFARRRVIDIRLALTLQHHGVTDFATVNTTDFRDVGFRRVWNPLGE